MHFRLIKFLTLICIALSAQSLKAQDLQKFSKLTLSPLLKERASLLDQKSEYDDLAKHEQERLNETDKIISDKLFDKIKNISNKQNLMPNPLLKASVVQKALPDNHNQVITGELYQEIYNYLSENDNYKLIGEKEVGDIFKYNSSFALGSKNFSGFSWEKAMGFYDITLNRQLAPMLFDDKKWLVTDTFKIQISAYTYLKKLIDADLIQIAPNDLRAFLGLSFIREYKYTHQSDSFQDGLTHDFTKLFFSFLKFNSKNFEVDVYDYVVKSDHFFIDSGLAASSNLGSGISATVAAMINKTKVSTISIQGVGPEDYPLPGEMFRISSEVENSKTIAAQADIVYDFFKLLKLTIFSYEYGVESSEKETTCLSLTAIDLEKIRKDKEAANELDKILSLEKIEIKELSHAVSQYEERLTQNSYSKFRLFFWGNFRQVLTQQIRLDINGVTKLFFKHAAEQVKYSESFLSSIFSRILSSLFDYNINAAHKATRIRRLEMDYENSIPFTTSTDVWLDSEKKLSINIIHHNFAYNTDGIINKKYKEYAHYFAKNFSLLTPDIITAIDKRTLIGPMTLETTIEVRESGLKYLNSLSLNQFKWAAANICNYKEVPLPRNVDELIIQSSYYARKYDTNEYRCFNEMIKNFDEYKKEHFFKRKTSLIKLKNLLTTTNKHVKRIDNYKQIFGSDNIFIHGHFYATDRQKIPFSYYFNDGKFQGFDVITSYKHNNIERLPASTP